MRKMVKIQGKQIPVSNDYAVMFRRVARALYPKSKVPHLTLQFYPSRLVTDDGVTYFRHSSLGFPNDYDYHMVVVMAVEKGWRK